MLDEEIKEEVTDLLSKLIRIDTTNPPGNETLAAKLLYDYLSSEGYEPEILEHVEGRGNLITSLKGMGRQGSCSFRTLMLYLLTRASGRPIPSRG